MNIRNLGIKEQLIVGLLAVITTIAGVIFIQNTSLSSLFLLFLSFFYFIPAIVGKNKENKYYFLGIIVIICTVTYALIFYFKTF